MEMTDGIKSAAELTSDAVSAAFPEVMILGMATGGDFTSAADAAVKSAKTGVSVALNTSKIIGLHLWG